METVHRLDGCRPEPLGSYLKGLGVLRLVGEQADPGATAWWQGEGMVLSTALGPEELEDFFLDDYCPTPLVAPWNGGSGFSPKDKEALQAVGLLRGTSADRFAPLSPPPWWRPKHCAARHEQGLVEKRMSSRCAGGSCRTPRWLGWTRPSCSRRANPGSPLCWGVAGNDGRLDFSANFMHRLADVLGLRTGRHCPIEARLAPVARRRHVRRSAGGGLSRPRLVSSTRGPLAAPILRPLGRRPAWSTVGLRADARGGASLRRSVSPAPRGRHRGEGRHALHDGLVGPLGYASSAALEKSLWELWAPLWTRPFEHR